MSRAARIQAGATGPRARGPAAPARAHAAPLTRSRSSSRRSAAGSRRARAATSRRSTRTSTTSSSRSARSRPAGPWESRRLPGSGAGPSPDRMLIGSEGILGVITEAWMRVQDAARASRPRPASRFARFDDRRRGGARARPVRAPPVELPAARPRRGRASPARRRTGRGAARARLRVRRPSARRLDGRGRSSCCRDHGGDAAAERAGRADGGAREPPRGRLAQRVPPGALPARHAGRGGHARETFETAITWDRFDAFVARRARASEQALAGAAARARVTCRFTHVYPDGAAPYFTVLAPARRGAELEQWDEIKAAAVRGDRSPRAARSPTTTRSAATTGPGTTASAPSRSPRRCARPRPRRPGRHPQSGRADRPV